MAANPGDLPIDPNVVDGTELAARLNRILPDVATLNEDKVSKYGDTMTGSLGVGGNPSQKFEVVGNAVFRGSQTINTNNSSRLYAGAYSGNYFTLISADSTSGGNNLQIGGGTSGGEPATTIYFNTGNKGALGAGSPRLWINDSGVGAGLNPLARNNTSLQTANGIGFPAAQVASTDPNTLDDYEEGVFTPNLVGSTSGSFPLVGRYTKVGNFAYCSIKLTTAIPANTLVGNLSITGLPFTCADVVDVPFPFIRGSTDPSANTRAMFGNTADSTLRLHSTATYGDTTVNPTAAPSFPAANIMQNGGTSVYICFDFVYRVS